MVLWHLGYPDQALKRIREALTLAQEQAHPFSLAIVLGFAAWLHQYRREGQETQERHEATVALATEQGLLFYAAWGTILRGWALAALRPGERRDCADAPRLGRLPGYGTEEMDRRWFLAGLAEAYGKRGRPQETLPCCRGAGCDGQTGEVL